MILAAKMRQGSSSGPHIVHEVMPNLYVSFGANHMNLMNLLIKCLAASSFYQPDSAVPIVNTALCWCSP